MASQQGHENQGPSSNESPVDQGQPQQIPRIELEDITNTTSTPPRGKGKKKVGFVGNGEGEGSGYADLNTSERNTPGEEYDSPGRDYFSSPGKDDQAHVPTPPGLNQAGNRDSFNKDELAAALSKILQPEHHGGPSRPNPRPAIRKHTRVGSDIEMATTPHRSELEARNRADRLAHAVGTSSVPPSGRSSPDQLESGMQTPFDGDSLLPVPPKAPGLFSGLRSRKGAHQTAKDLVRTHTRRGRLNPMGESSTGLISGGVSGTATPVLEDIEYVPRPEKFKGGVLGSLLKLYNAESKKDGADSSFLTTPRGTPNRTPNSTPPTSRPGTPQPGSRPTRPNLRPRPHSSSTLAGLMESSFVFAAPGSSKDISDAVSDKLKAESQKAPKKRSRSRQKEEYRITIHIAEIINRHRYLVKLCRALMMYGAPTHRLEGYMMMSARVLGIEGQFMYLPGIMMISFDDSNTHTTEMKIVRSPQGVDLGKLRDTHEIYKEVVHDRIGVEEATRRLEAVIARQPQFPRWLRLILYGLASAFVSPFGFQGRYIDMPLCVVLGCLVGYLQLYLAPTNELYANVFEITAAVATSFLARVLGSINGGTLFCFSTLAQSSIALILPGYMVLSASLELQSHQMISGSVRMVYALIYSLFLGYGITIGSVLYGYLDKNAVSEVTCTAGDKWYLQKPPPNFYLLFVLPFTLCLCAINQAKWKQTPVMVVIALAGFCVNHFSSRYFQGSSTLSSSLGALCVGVLANLYARLGRYVKNYMLDIWESQIEPRTCRLFKKRRPYYFGGEGAGANAKDEDGNGSDDKEEKFVRRRGAPVQAGKDTDETEEEDPELGLGDNEKGVPMTRRVRQIGFGLAAAAMLPGIFVQVPSGLAVGGSLLSGVQSADMIVRNETVLANGTTISTSADVGPGDLSNTAFNVLLSVIQVAISISVGLSLSALIVYPYGKRRSGLFSF
ncbi:Protein of unknown function (DUF1212) domain containing protein [Rhypophila decipiens]